MPPVPTEMYYCKFSWSNNPSEINLKPVSHGFQYLIHKRAKTNSIHPSKILCTSQQDFPRYHTTKLFCYMQKYPYGHIFVGSIFKYLHVCSCCAWVRLTTSCLLCIRAWEWCPSPLDTSNLKPYSRFIVHGIKVYFFLKCYTPCVCYLIDFLHIIML